MQNDLIITLIVLSFGTAVAFFAYWHGFNAGREEHRAYSDALLDDLDLTTRLLGEMSAKQRHPSTRLRAVEES